MNARELEMWKRRFLVLKILLEDYFFEETAEKIRVKVANLDRKFLEQRLVNQHFPDENRYWKLYVAVENRTFSWFPLKRYRWTMVKNVFLRNHTVRKNRKKSDQTLLLGQAVYWSLQEAKRDFEKIRQMALVHVTEEKREITSLNITILRIPGNISLERYLKKISTRDFLETMETLR